MRSLKFLAVAAFAALPLTATSASAAQVAPGVGKALATQIDGRANVIDVQRRGGGGFSGMRGGGGFRGMRGGGGFRGMRGGGPRFGAMRGGHARGIRGGPRHGFRGGRRHWHGGHHHHHRHWRRRFYPAWYGVPYYYDYGPSYYYDDYDYGSYDDDAVARCAARYRSFDASTGTFLHVSGERRRCPYL